MRRRLLCFAISLLGVAPIAAAELSGQVEYSGEAVDQLPATTFVPTTFSSTEQGWAFLDEVNGLSILLLQLDTDPTKAGFVSTGVANGPSWFALSSLVGVGGVVIDGNTVTFTDALLFQSGKRRASLILNGELTRPTEVGLERRNWSRLKADF